jgi:hypothetical protein
MRVNNKVKKQLSGNQYKKHAREPLKQYATRTLRRGERREIRAEQSADVQREIDTSDVKST